MDKSAFLSEAFLRQVLLGERLPLPSKSLAYWIALHVSDPGLDAAQDENEIVYAGYDRLSVKRTAAVWRIEGGMAVNAERMFFPICSGGGGLVTHATLGLGRAGATAVLWRMRVRAPLSITPGIRPVLPPGALEILET